MQEIQSLWKMCHSSGKLDAVKTKDSKPNETGDDYLFLDLITAAVDETKTPSLNQAEYVTLSVNNTKVKMKLDTGAEVNVIPIKTYKTLASSRQIPRIMASQSPLKLYANCNAIIEKSMIWNFT